jgi:phospholipase/carboxylesterase
MSEQTKEMNVYALGPASGGKPKQLVILLHGLGSNGQDLISLAPFFAKSLPDALFLSPDAPFECDMAPMGYQWFSLQDRSYEAILKGVQTAAPILNDFIDHQLKTYGLTDKDLTLIGFSQGTMMSLYTGPRRKNEIAGIIGYSGALITEKGQPLSAHNKPPILLIHGEADEVVPIESYHSAKKVLEASGFSVSGHSTEGLSHSIDDKGISSAQGFLEDVYEVVSKAS